jgi:hypothetical protein
MGENLGDKTFGDYLLNGGVEGERFFCEKRGQSYEVGKWFKGNGVLYFNVEYEKDGLVGRHILGMVDDKEVLNEHS